MVYSIWSSTPFRCYGDSVTFNEMELRQVPMSWLLWVIISLLCHTCVYNYYSFTAGRITAVTLQVFSLSLCLLDHTNPKWGLMIQITNVVYPCATLFWICVVCGECLTFPQHLVSLPQFTSILHYINASTRMDNRLVIVWFAIYEWTITDFTNFPAAGHYLACSIVPIAQSPLSGWALIRLLTLGLSGISHNTLPATAAGEVMWDIKISHFHPVEPLCRGAFVPILKSDWKSEVFPSNEVKHFQENSIAILVVPWMAEKN